MKQIFSINIFIASALMLLTACGKDAVYNYTDDSAPAPAQVSNVQVIPGPGGGVIAYTIPQDPNLSYVKATYELKPGETSEVKASIFKDSLYINGFGDTSPREIKIYSVGKNEKESAPITVNLTPMDPPVQSVFEDITMEPAFGGVRVRYQNPLKANLAMMLLYDSSGNGTWREVKANYTALPEGTFSIRGFSATPKKFAVFVRDRWNNYSDTLVQTVTPLFEEFIPKDTWKPLYLPNDHYQHVEFFDITRVYNGEYRRQVYEGIFATRHTSPIPQWFTLDLGKKVVFSRMKEWQYFESPYAGASVKSFEIWGSNDPAPDGSWESWTKLGTFESFKPSGLPYGTVNDVDRAYALDEGEDFEFPETADQAYRYIRFKTLSTYASSGPTGQVVINEISFWGKIVP